MKIEDLSRPVHVYDIKELDGDDARVAGVSVNRNGLVAIVNEKHKKVHLFDSNRRHLHEFSIEQEGNDNDLYITSQAWLDHKGNLMYITFDDDQIFRYNLNGKRLPPFSEMKDRHPFGGLSLGPTLMGFTVSSNGTIAVSSASPKFISYYYLDESPSSLCILIDGKKEPNSINEPGALCFGPDGFLYVACVPDIYALDKNGAICREIKTQDGQGQRKTEGLFITGNGYIFAVDYGKHEISVISPEGDLVHTFGSHGKEEGCFDQPVGISMDFEGYLYVADSANGRVQVF